MHMSVHQGKSQYYYVILQADYEDTVHSCDKIIFITKHIINCISVCAEMPAVLYWNVLAFYKCPVKTQIRYDLSEQFICYSHLQFRRLLWLLCDNSMKIII